MCIPRTCGLLILLAKMHRYLVRYIGREGHSEERTFLANSKGEAKRIAYERGCEDVFKVKRIGFPVTAIVIGLIVLIGLLYLVLKS